MEQRGRTGRRAGGWGAVGAWLAAVVLVAGCTATPQAGGTAGAPSSSVSEVSPSAPAPSSASPSGQPSSSGQPPSPATTPTATPRPRRTASLVFSGDLLWHNTLWISAAEDNRRTRAEPEFDFDPMFAAMKPVIEDADLAVCHEEVPFAAEGGPYTGYPTFKAPPAIAPWIASMGWDACTLTSNHSLDAGFTGLVRTHDLLERHGVAPVGTSTSAARAATPTLLTTDSGITVALIGSTYGLNGLTPPAGKEWSVQLIDVPALLARARAARRAGADLVIVQVHAGDEYAHRPNAQQRQVAQALTASPDVDAVVGQHAHVVQPITKVNGKWVVYGMGNMVAQHRTNVPRGAEGITVRLNAVERADGTVEVATVDYLPTLVTHYAPGSPVRLLPVVQSLDEGVGPTARLRTARSQVREAVTLLGVPAGLTER